MTITAVLRGAQSWGPVLFGVGFVAPLVTQSLDAASMDAPWGASNLTFGLALGLTLGLIAKVRGRWL